MVGNTVLRWEKYSMEPQLNWGHAHQFLDLALGHNCWLLSILSWHLQDPTISKCLELCNLFIFHESQDLKWHLFLTWANSTQQAFLLIVLNMKWLHCSRKAKFNKTKYNKKCLAWLYTETLRKMVVCSLSAKCIMHSSLWNYVFVPFHVENAII